MIQTLQQALDITVSGNASEQQVAAVLLQSGSYLLLQSGNNLLLQG